jgi:ribonuclease P protein component
MMGKRDDRLHGPEAFQQALMTRPVSRSGSFLIYRIPSHDGMRIGFVLPKKLVRTAVQRNQIKRWARDFFRQPNTHTAPEFALVVRVKNLVPKLDWNLGGRKNTRHHLVRAMEQAIENHL